MKMATKKPTTASATTAGDLPKIGNPATNALAHIGITTLKQVAKLTEKELLAIHGVGPKAAAILRDALAERGLSFRAPPKN
jgi:predicted flap endonuclease-1-like 5' DNA nuclease